MFCYFQFVNLLKDENPPTIFLSSKLKQKIALSAQLKGVCCLKLITSFKLELELELWFATTQNSFVYRMKLLKEI